MITLRGRRAEAECLSVTGKGHALTMEGCVVTVWYFTNHKGNSIVGQPNAVFSQRKGVAWEANGWFVATGFHHQEGEQVCRDEATKYTDIKAWIASSFEDPTPVEVPYVPGTYYERIWRPSVHQDAPLSHYYLTTATDSFIALTILIKKLEDLFEFVTPSTETQNAYGHKIRELLLLACMEVESSWKAVLRANGLVKDWYNTEDYVKLRPAMFLDAYSLRLTSYNYPQIEPFKGWETARATRSLAWYHAYNQTKHDREKNLNLATLAHAVTAVGAAVVMMYAQFGFVYDRGGHDVQNLKVLSMFRPIFDAFYEAPEYQYGLYVPEMRFGQIALRPELTGIWNKVRYPFA